MHIVDAHCSSSWWSSPLATNEVMNRGGQGSRRPRSSPPIGTSRNFIPVNSIKRNSKYCRRSSPRLAKIESAESEDDSRPAQQSLPPPSPSPPPPPLLQQQQQKQQQSKQQSKQHPLLHMRASSPIEYNNRTHFAVTARQHHSEPPLPSCSILSRCVSFSDPTSSSSTWLNPHHHHRFDLSDHSSHDNIDYIIPHHSHDPKIDHNDDDGDDGDDRPRNVLLEKYSSDCPINRATGGMTLCGGNPDEGLPGIYVSRVARNSAAAKCGIHAGDQILSANWRSFVDARNIVTLRRAYAIIGDHREHHSNHSIDQLQSSSSSSSSTVLLTILPRRAVFASPHRRHRHHAYTWVDADGRPVSPPPPVELPLDSITGQQHTRGKTIAPENNPDDPDDAEDGRRGDEIDQGVVIERSSELNHHHFSPPPPPLPPLPPPPPPNSFIRNRRAPHLRQIQQFATTVESNHHPHHHHHRSNSSSASNRFHDDDNRHKRKAPPLGQIRSVTISVGDGDRLGLHIRGGLEYGLGIYAARIGAGSLAEAANLTVGDQILSLNSLDFTAVLHDEAVDALECASQLNMRVLHVGKVPQFKPRQYFANSSPPPSKNNHLNQIIATTKTPTNTTTATTIAATNTAETPPRSTSSSSSGIGADFFTSSYSHHHHNRLPTAAAAISGKLPALHNQHHHRNRASGHHHHLNYSPPPSLSSNQFSFDSLEDRMMMKMMMTTTTTMMPQISGDASNSTDSISSSCCSSRSSSSSSNSGSNSSINNSKNRTNMLRITRHCLRSQSSFSSPSTSPPPLAAIGSDRQMLMRTRSYQYQLPRGHQSGNHHRDEEQSNHCFASVAASSISPHRRLFRSSARQQDDDDVDEDCDNADRVRMHETPTLLITDIDDNNSAISTMTGIDSSLPLPAPQHPYLHPHPRDNLRRRMVATKSEEDDATLDEECAKRLNDNERLTLAYYRNEYETKAMTIETLIALLSELLDTEEKYTIIFRFYHVIRPEDIDRFDELAYHRELHAAMRDEAIRGGKYRHLFRPQPLFIDGHHHHHHHQSPQPPLDRVTVSTNDPYDNVDISAAATMRTDSALQPQQPPPHIELPIVVEHQISDDIRRSYAIELPRQQQPQQLQQQHHHHMMQANSIQVNQRLSRSECHMIRSPSPSPSRRPRASTSSSTSVAPNSAAYRKQFMLRRHSSGTSDTPITRDEMATVAPSYSGIAARDRVNQFCGNIAAARVSSFPFVDERRWSISAAECRRPSVLLNRRNDLRRSPSRVAASGAATSTATVTSNHLDDTILDNDGGISYLQSSSSPSSSQQRCEDISQMQIANQHHLHQPHHYHHHPHPHHPHHLYSSSSHPDSIEMQPVNPQPPAPLDGLRPNNNNNNNSDQSQPDILSLSVQNDDEDDDDEDVNRIDQLGQTFDNMAPTLAPASGAIRGSGNHLHVPGNLPDDDEHGHDHRDSDSGDEAIAFRAHLRVRRHRSLPSPTFLTGDPRAAAGSSSTASSLASSSQFDSRATNSQHQRSASFRLPNHRISAATIVEPNGRWRVKVKKTRKFLGIAIEGGENVTTQTQPRIISIHNDGAAVECDDLHVGHIILEVDGQSTENVKHTEVAQMISRAYYNTPHKDYVEFLVREKNRNEFDLRRSSFMLLNNSFE